MAYMDPTQGRMVRYRSPLALIKYSLEGAVQEYGLRLDLDKRVFLDHFEDEERERTLRKAAPEIVRYLGSVLYPRDRQRY